MKLKDRNPEIIEAGGRQILLIDCPHSCPHRIAIIIVGEARAIWGKGDFDKLTLESPEPLKCCGLPFSVTRGVVTV